MGLGGRLPLSCLAVCLSLALVGTRCSSSHSSSTTAGTTGGSGSGSSGGSGSGGSGGSGGGASSAKQQYLYVSNQGPNTVSAFTIKSDGSLSAVSGSPFAVGGPNVAAAPNQNFLFSFAPGLQTDTINSDGSLKATSSISDTNLTGGISIDPAGTFLYIASMEVVPANPGWKIYAIQPDGSLKFVNGVENNTAGRLVFTSDGTFAYSAYCYHLDAEILQINVAANGNLTVSNASIPQVGGFGECPNAVALSPSGKTVGVPYSNAAQGAGATVDNQLGVYNADPMTHALSPIPNSPFKASGAGVDATFDPSGTFLLVAQDNGVGVYQIAQNSATEITGSPFGGGTLERVMFSPSGAFVVATSREAGQVFVFSFDASSGRLTMAPGSPNSTTNPSDLAMVQR